MHVNVYSVATFSQDNFGRIEDAHGDHHLPCLCEQLSFARPDLVEPSTVAQASKGVRAPCDSPMRAGRTNAERQQARRRRQRGPLGDEAPEVTGGPAPGLGAGRGTTRRPRARSPDNGLWRNEDEDEWLARGVSASTVPRVEAVIRLAHRHRWPLRVVDEDGWTCVLIPCFTDLADGMERILQAVAGAEPGSGGDDDVIVAPGASSSTARSDAPPSDRRPAGGLEEEMDLLAADMDADRCPADSLVEGNDDLAVDADC